MLAELDVPPTVDPTLTKLLDETFGPYDGLTGAALTITEPISGNAETVTAFLVGLTPHGTALQFSVPMSSSIRALEGYRIEVYGSLIDPEVVQTDESRIWQMTIPQLVHGGPPETFWLLGHRRRAFLGNTPLHAELRWHPGLYEEDEHIRFGGLEHLNSQSAKARRSELEKLDAAIDKLKGLSRIWTGSHRPQGSYDIETTEAYAELIYREIYDKPSRDRTVEREPPSVIAFWLGISESTIDRNKHRLGIGIRDIRYHRVPRPN